MFELSIVIPTRNRSAALMKALMGIERGTHCTYEVIVVDGASTDSTEEVLMLASSILGSRLRVVRENGVVGFGRACNEGLAIARGRNVCVLHDDVHPIDGALDTAINQLDREIECEAILALAWDRPGDQIAERRNIGTEFFATTHVGGTLVAEFPLARRQTFEAIGFDPSIKTSAATVDFSLRAWTSGLAIGSAVASPLRSHVAETLDDLAGRAEREAIAKRAGLSTTEARFHPRSPCTLTRRDVRKVA